MRTFFCSPLAVVASLQLLAYTVALGAGHHQDHAHGHLHIKRSLLLEKASSSLDCTTTTAYTTFYGEPTLIQPAEQMPLIVASQSSPTSAASTYPLSTSIRTAQSSTLMIYVAPSSTPIIAENSNTARPASKPSEGTSSNIKSKPASSSSSAPSTQTSKSSPVGASGSKWSMTYSPYNADGSCKDSSSVAPDVKSIASKGFNAIRLYSTDCDGLTTVGRVAKSCGLKLILGVFISSTGISAAEGQIQDIIEWAAGDWGCIEMIVIGNEAIFNQFASAKDLADLICRAREAFKKAGYSGPITTTEPLSVLRDNAEVLCHILDIAAANIHPFFNSGVDAKGAGDFVARELQLLKGICPGLPVYNLETGWPSAGQPNGAAVPGIQEQRIAIESIEKIAGGNSAFFSFVDDLWKTTGAFGVERSWGCSHLFAKEW